LNAGGYYDKLLEFMAYVDAEGMFRGARRGLLKVATTVDEALAIVEGEWAKAAPSEARRKSGLKLT
jgi:hypothetical protein